MFGGTLGVTMAGTTMEHVKKIPSLYKIAFSPPELRLPRPRGARSSSSPSARAARACWRSRTRSRSSTTSSRRKGLQLVVDGTDPDLVREILDNEIDGMVTPPPRTAPQVFEKAGGFAPTLGILGTVCSLVHVLQNLSNPDTLGPAISGAFIATLMRRRLRQRRLPARSPTSSRRSSAEEAELRTLTVEGILAIQAGDNPRVVEDKLLAFLSPEQRGRRGAGGGRRRKPDLAEAA